MSLQIAWYQKQWWLNFLLPFSFLFGAIVKLRRACYRAGLCKTTSFQVPVIVIGNVTVGGTGKTPLVIALAQFLQQQGYHPGIVSRGYGGRALHYPLSVTAESNPYEVGDEAVLMARRTGCPVVIAPKRVKAVRYLLHRFACDIVLSDDGLQHYALGRDIEIAVIDGKRGFGNGLGLPAGPLREPVNRLEQVDFIISHDVLNPQIALPKKAYLMRLKPICMRNVADPQRSISLLSLYGQQVHAFAGIGHPQRFFEVLKQLGMRVEARSFADHYRFTHRDLQQFNSHKKVLMTEKDAVKCQHLIPVDTKQFWYMEVAAQLEPSFQQQLLNAIMRLPLKYTSINHKLFEQEST
ncbi:MAG: tetraacyldisaccharide 4'-kinase [Gammaproteobacteria bacterium]